MRGVQSRIRLTRSFDQRYHTYLGYVLSVAGVAGDSEGEFTVALGKGAQAKHGFRAEDEASGASQPV